MPILHPVDFVAARILHSDTRRLDGCCGMRADNGLNLVCTCGAEIAAESTDCQMPHAVWLAPSAVEAIEAADNDD